MARRLRFIPSRALVEVSARTMQGRLLMTPTKQVADIVLGILGRAQARYRMVIHAFQFLSDHYHMLLSPENAEQLAGFMCYVNGNIAREIGRWAQWKDKFWGRRYTSIVISDEEAAQEARLKYLIANGCKEGLVASPTEWPGASVAEPLLNGVDTLTGLWYDRSKEYRTKRSGKTQTHVSVETVKISPLPCWAHLSKAEIKKRFALMVREVEDETASEHESRGTIPLGVDKVLNQNCHGVPKRLKNSPTPPFITATHRAMQELLDAYNSFASCFRQAAEKLKVGDLNIVFPPGSFPPRGPYIPLTSPG